MSDALSLISQVRVQLIDCILLVIADYYGAFSSDRVIRARLTT